MDQKLLTIAVIAEKELTVSLNLDLTTIKDSAKDKKLYPDHTVEFFALVVLNPELSEHSF
jgi:hypothetical protein